MTLAPQLMRARRLLEQNGIALPPLLQMFDGYDAGGRGVSRTDEGIVTFTVDGALAYVSADVEQLLALRRALERVATPAFTASSEFFCSLPPAALEPEWWAGQVELARRALMLMHAEAANPAGLEAWLELPGRSVADVLRVFAVAILRSRQQTENTK